jgi:hypothetical protein
MVNPQSFARERLARPKRERWLSGNSDRGKVNETVRQYRERHTGSAQAASDRRTILCMLLIAVLAIVWNVLGRL